MASLSVALFGIFELLYDRKQIEGIESQKAKELLSYLLIHRERMQPREKLAELLWENQVPAKSKKYLRQAIWRLKTALGVYYREVTNDLVVETDWIQLNPSPDFWQVDIVEFDRIHLALKNKRARELSIAEFTLLQHAVDLYRGDLLEGFYQDWCLFERERFRAMYMLMLNKLVQYCEIYQHYEIGLAYGQRLLHYDRAYERVHRQMMRMYFMAGDRTLALRQYETCVKALQEELSVTPSERTRQLYEKIKADHHLPRPAAARVDFHTTNSLLQKTVERLDHYAETLTLIQSQIQEEIITLENRFQTGE